MAFGLLAAYLGDRFWTRSKRGRTPFLRMLFSAHAKNCPFGVYRCPAPHCSARHRREDVFFDEADRVAYLGWLDEYCAESKVKVLAYCLMTNHVHVVAVPGSDQALERVFRPLHTRYAQRVNRAKGRLFSSALDDTYRWAVIRYVERNPARARRVRRAENYPSSRAAAHCGLKVDRILTADPAWIA
ncbi:MAG: transposase [Pseudomonadota bacterium]|nr:transposase [Pseudomonadota bacterium]